MKTLTRNEYLQLVGLCALAKQHYAMLDSIEKAAQAITGDTGDGHTADILVGFRGLDDGLMLMDIVVDD